MEEEGVPSTALREVSLLQMLSESNHVVKCAPLPASCLRKRMHSLLCTLLRRRCLHFQPLIWRAG